MNPVLLYTDTQRIADEQTTLLNVVTLYQSVYNAIKAVGVTPSLTEINQLANAAKKQDPYNIVKEYIIDKLVIQAGPQSLNGLQLNRAAIKSMIAVPDINGIIGALQPVTGGGHQSLFVGDAKGVRLDLLTLSDDVVNEVPDADDKINKLHTYYTETEASAKLATELQAICDALNVFNASNEQLLTKRIPNASSYDRRFEGNESSIPGLFVSRGKFVVSVTFIRKFEQVGTPHFTM
jgi:hypothetical protein